MRARPLQPLSPILVFSLSLALAGCPAGAGGGKPDPAAGSAVNASSTVVQIGGGVVGTLVLPATEHRSPAVLMLHGFASKRDEVGDLYKTTATALAAEGLASLRIDFRGSGDSEGAFRETTIERQMADAERALTTLRQHAAIDPDRIGVLGFSLGGAVAILTANQQAEKVASMVVWSTVGDLEVDLSAHLGCPASTGASVTCDLGWRKVELLPGFFRSLDRWDIAGALLGFEGPFLAIAGTEDPLSRYARELSQSIDGMAVYVREADHIFNVLDPAESQADTVVQATVVHFASTLKWKEGEDRE